VKRTSTFCTETEVVFENNSRERGRSRDSFRAEDYKPGVSLETALNLPRSVTKEPLRKGATWSYAR